MSDLLDYLTAPTLSQAPVIPKGVFAQVLNIWLRQFSKFNQLAEPATQTVVGSKTYPLGPGTDLPKTHPAFPITRLLGSGVQSTRGYFSSIRFGAARAWVNINVTHGAFFESGPLQRWIRNAGFEPQYHQNAASEYEERQRLQYQLQLYKQLHGSLKGRRVRLTHRTAKVDGNQKDIIKVISGLATQKDGVPDKGERPPDNPPRVHPDALEFGAKCQEVKFYDRSKGDHVTVFDYFHKAYPELPVRRNELVVNVGSKLKPAYYPVSLCDIVEGQNYRPKLSENQTREMIQFALLNPIKSVDCITQHGFERIGLHGPGGSRPPPHAELLNPAAGLAVTQGRILAGPSVHYGNGRVDKQQGKWNLVNAGKYSTSGRPAVWAFLPIGRLKGAGTERWGKMAGELKQLMAKRGFTHSDSTTLTHVLAPCEPPLTRQAMATRLKELRKKGYNLLFVLLRDKNADTYSVVKTAADITAGIHTICMVEPNIPRFDSQRFDNILLKANLKQGGVNHTLKFPALEILSKWRAMIVGLDVTHSPPGAGNATPSIVGMVANIDGNLAQWPATISFQSQENEEIVSRMDSFDKLLGPHLTRYASKNASKKYPEVLIVYRDGVSEGQYDHVIDYEYTQIRAVCEKMYGSKNQPLPKISIIVVGKRHHTRFYPREAENADHKGNTLPGTVVDRSITSQFLWEFYLQAHEAIQGTARPAHYVVVVDEFFGPTFALPQNRPRTQPPYQNAADVLEALTHGLSYALGRSTRSAGVCTPARLADKVCDRARCYINAGLKPHEVVISDALKDTMFYT
ncbi:ribonuclease H-like domain-containing protein [Parachaetomium inaequale]|uniref:Ribonuclease H-like domain-containing protein n=1 Tax=Parachaetomium inaequale TaxID=2588326 RepID=A0AAN6PJT1_9PEZI|nr:ribonuclease H-like domain-containing protein [Parachaetomium inaequale]